MKVVKTTLCRLSVYYLLLAIGIIPCANIIPDAFPARNLSTIYVLFLSACLIRYYLPKARCAVAFNSRHVNPR